MLNGRRAKAGTESIIGTGLRTYRVLLAIAGATILLDQATKLWAFERLRNSPIQLFGGALRLDYTTNSGAAFSTLPQGGILFTAIAVLVSTGIIVYYPRVLTSPWLSRLPLGLVLGGALGNLIDRLRLGHVVDFIDLRWWPVFNVADSAIVAGLGLIILQSLLPGDRH